MTQKKKGLLIQGKTSEYGLMVDTVNGEEAVFEKDGATGAFLSTVNTAITGFQSNR